MARRSTTLAAATAAGVGAALGARAGARRLALGVDRRYNAVHEPGPYQVSEATREVHDRLVVVDLHADSLLWGRDLLVRGDHGHLDVPRMAEGGVAIEVFAVSTKIPGGANLERNGDRTDYVLLLALANGWPRSTWGSLFARAVYHAERLWTMAAASDGRLTVITERSDLAVYLERRRLEPGIVAGFLAIEGAHALDGDLANVDRLADAGFRMMSISHLFDNDFGGSAHGKLKGGLTRLGRELISRLEARSMIVDVAHASSTTIDDVLAVAQRPVVASHTGVRASHESNRNLADDQVRGIAATGGLIGIGFWPEATGGRDVASIVHGINATVALAGVEHVALGSDFDGAVAVPFDATGVARITEALIADGFSEPSIAAIMGGNALRVLRESLPEGPAVADRAPVAVAVGEG